MACTIADLFEHAVDRFPDRLALVCDDGERTYARLEERANRLAHHLAANGVTAGAHVGLCTGNGIEAVETMLAVYKLRAVLVNVNYRYTATEMRYVLDNADVVALVHDRRFAATVAEAAAGVPRLQHLVVVHDGSDASYAGTPFEAAVGDGGPGRDFGPRSNDDLYLLYTGGTTGRPKGVMWRHEDVWRTLGGGINFVTGEPLADEFAQAEQGAATGGLVRLCLAPLIHGNAQWAALMALFSGDTVVLMPHFDPAEVWAVVARRRVNLIVLVGDAMARPLIEAFTPAVHDRSSLFAVSSSAALFSPAVKQQYLQGLPGVVVTDSIGSSETGFMGMGMVTQGGDHGAGGPRVTLTGDCIVIDEQANPIAPGDSRIGRLARRGHIPLGYYRDPDRTAELFVDIGGSRYSVPGDYARYEDADTITLLGRGSTCVNTGGEKVFPEEVEAALMAHPDVLDVLVVGVPDDRLGQRVAAVVQPRPGATPAAADLDAHVRRELAGFKAPRSIWLVDRVHRMATGKADYGWALAHATGHPDADLLAS